MNKTQIEWCDYYKGWIEALIDGEGNLSLIKEKRPHFTAGCTYRPELAIGNKSLPLLEQAQLVIGAGAISARSKDGLYALHVTANALRDFLPQITLIVKEQQRENLLDALNVLSRHAGRSSPRTPTELTQLKNLWTYNRYLNGGKNDE